MSTLFSHFLKKVGNTSSSPSGFVPFKNGVDLSWSFAPFCTVKGLIWMKSQGLQIPVQPIKLTLFWLAFWSFAIYFYVLANLSKGIFVRPKYLTIPSKAPLAIWNMIMGCYATGAKQYLRLHYWKVPFIVFCNQPTLWTIKGAERTALLEILLFLHPNSMVYYLFLNPFYLPLYSDSYFIACMLNFKFDPSTCVALHTVI